MNKLIVNEIKKIIIALLKEHILIIIIYKML